ncbi:MAG: hypothetical protein NVSMB31_04950 [Vulcanimicrobiaceae bacterium]
MKTAFVSAALFFASFGSSAFAADQQTADQLFAAGNFTAAKAAYEQVLAQKPGDLMATVGLARTALYENHLDEAQAAANRALSGGGQNALALGVLKRVSERRAVEASAQAVLIPAMGVSIPFLASEPLPLLRMKINGHDANLLLDTGAPDLAIDPEFAKELHLKSVAAGTGTFAGNRKMEMQAASIDRVSVGGLTVRHLTADLIPSRGLPFFADKHLRVDGVVGTIFLSRFLSTIDYPNSQLILKPRSQKLLADSRSIVIPFWLIGDHMLFARGSVNGSADSLFLVDSGLAGGGFMPTEATVSSAHVTTFPDKATEGIGGGGPVKFVPVVADTLCLGIACQHKIEGGYTPGGDPLSIFPFTAAGAVSHDFLKHYAVTISFNAMLMQLTTP